MLGKTVGMFTKFKVTYCGSKVTKALRNGISACMPGQVRNPTELLGCAAWGRRTKRTDGRTTTPTISDAAGDALG